MQHTNARTIMRRNEPAPVWVLIAGVVMLLLALGPQLATPVHASSVPPAVTAHAEP